MEKLSNSAFDDPGNRFALDNIRDGFKDGSILVWEAYDTLEDKSVWILGRKIRQPDTGGIDVLPCAIVLSSSLDAVRRYAPASGQGGWDYRKIDGGSRIIRP